MFVRLSQELQRGMIFRSINDRALIFGMQAWSLWQALSFVTILSPLPWLLTYLKVKFVARRGITILHGKLPPQIHFPSMKIQFHQFYAPGLNDRGHIVFVLSVCLSVVNFNIRYNFWTVRGRDFIFGMHILLMTPFQMTLRSMTLWPWLWPSSQK